MQHVHAFRTAILFYDHVPHTNRVASQSQLISPDVGESDDDVIVRQVDDHEREMLRKTRAKAELQGNLTGGVLERSIAVTDPHGSEASGGLKTKERDHARRDETPTSSRVVQRTRVYSTR